jgi:transketolase
MHTIKPLDREAIMSAARETGAIVTAEEHQVHGGLGSAVAEVLSTQYTIPLEIIAVQDTFGESGAPQELLKKYHLKDNDIVKAVHRVLKRKGR